MTTTSSTKLTIFGASNIISDIIDCALANNYKISKIVLDEPEGQGDRDLPLAARLASWSSLIPIPTVLNMATFEPEEQEAYILGPTTPRREALLAKITNRWALKFCTLVHPSAYVAPLSSLGEGVFIGANSVVAPGTRLDPHVFVNRGVTIGHDNTIGAFSRIQPGANLGGLSVYGERVTIGIGATVLERIHVGHDSVIAGGAVVLKDVPPLVMVAGVPAVVKKSLETK